MVMEATRLRVLDPTSELLPAHGARAARIGELEGKSVGFLANGKRNADRFLQVLSELLKERYSLREVVARSKSNASTPAPATILDELAQRCDAVIVGVGD